MKQWTFQPVGFLRSPYTDTSQIPKGPGAEHHAEGVLEVLPEYEEGLLDIEGFSHLFLIWVFDRSEGFKLTGIPPSDDRPHGVFATRSPFRPNPIGLSVVQLLRREGHRLHLRGVDMLDGTPILDIKPYLSGVPPDQMKRGWLDAAEARRKPKGSMGPAAVFPLSRAAITEQIGEQPRKYCLDCRIFFEPKPQDQDTHASHYALLLPRSNQDFETWVDRIRRRDEQIWGVMLDEDGVSSTPFCPSSFVIEVKE